MSATPEITDDDLRDLFQRMELAPEEIERHLANPHTKAYTKSVLNAIHSRVAEQLAQRLIEKFFSNDDEVMVSIRRKVMNKDVLN